mgnify:CR=1 FL=1
MTGVDKIIVCLRSVSLCLVRMNFVAVHSFAVPSLTLLATPLMMMMVTALLPRTHDADPAMA